MNQQNKQWVSAYLFYAEPWDKFLAQTIKPFIEKTLSKNWANQYFFIRYWEKGPHIRLRFKSSQDKINKFLKPELKQYFLNFFKKNPSNRRRRKKEWARNNSIQFVKYEPEVERYGGPIGIKIAERQFQASSNAALSAIDKDKNWSYQRALGTALQLSLSLSYAYGLKPKQSADFFNFFVNHRLPKKTRQKQLLLYAKYYQNQKDKLIPYIQNFWRMLKKKEINQPEWLSNWIKANSEIHKQLTTANKKGKLKINSCKCLKGKPAIWSLYESYVHMTNNRLGIKLSDEGLIAYLLKKNMSKIVTKESNFRGDEV